MATVFELDSFYYKFKTLIQSGFSASLNLRTVNGRICVDFNADLGPLSFPSEIHPLPQQRRCRNQAYFRRQSKRRINSHASTFNGASNESHDDLIKYVSPKPNEENTVNEESISESVNADLDDFYEYPSSMTPTHVETVKPAIAIEDIEFGDEVSRILNALPANPSHELPLTHSSNLYAQASNPVAPQISIQPMNEANEEIDMPKRTLAELTRNEFYALMNSCLGLDIRPI